MGQEYSKGFLWVFRSVAGLSIAAVLLGVIGISTSYTPVSVAQGVSTQNNGVVTSGQKNLITPSPESNQSKSNKLSTENGESAGVSPGDSTPNPSHNGDSCQGTTQGNKGPSCLQDIVYKVQPGDTLSSISQKFSISVDTLVKYNDIHDANWIYANSSIRIPYTELKNK